jgi:hypothetical protein
MSEAREKTWGHRSPEVRFAFSERIAALSMAVSLPFEIDRGRPTFPSDMKGFDTVVADWCRLAHSPVDRSHGYSACTVQPGTAVVSGRKGIGIELEAVSLLTE